MTEKNYNPEQKSMKTMQKQRKADGKQDVSHLSAKVEHLQKIEPAEVKKPEEKIEDKKEETKVEEKKESIVKEKKQEENKKTDVKEEKKQKTKPKIKKNEAIVNGISLPISTKDSVAICRFIKKKTIAKAIADLEEVLKFKKAIPMKGEIPHRKGKGIMAGRYPIYAVQHFIKLLKNLQANSNVNELDEPIIVEAIPNRASLPYGRFGSIRRKRTHVRIKAKERKIIQKEKKK